MAISAIPIKPKSAGERILASTSARRNCTAFSMRPTAPMTTPPLAAAPPNEMGGDTSSLTLISLAARAREQAMDPREGGVSSGASLRPRRAEYEDFRPQPVRRELEVLSGYDVQTVPALPPTRVIHVERLRRVDP